MKLYSGAFTQFFLGDWQVVQPENDLENSEPTDDEEEASTDDVIRYFESFKDQLAGALSEETPTTLVWSETLEGLHHVIELDEREFGALLTIAARVAVADKRMNPVSPNKEWHMDPAVIAIQDAEGDYLPVHHLVKADSWLPSDFTTIIETEVPERDIIFGSLNKLASALKTMDHILNTPNEATRKLSAHLVGDARVALVAFHKIVDWALTHRMPILIEP